MNPHKSLWGSRENGIPTPKWNWNVPRGCCSRPPKRFLSRSCMEGEDFCMNRLFCLIMWCFQSSHKNLQCRCRLLFFSLVSLFGHASLNQVFIIHFDIGTSPLVFYIAFSQEVQLCGVWRGEGGGGVRNVLLFDNKGGGGEGYDCTPWKIAISHEEAVKEWLTKRHRNVLQTEAWFENSNR